MSMDSPGFTPEQENYITDAIIPDARHLERARIRNKLQPVLDEMRRLEFLMEAPIWQTIHEWADRLEEATSDAEPRDALDRMAAEAQKTDEGYR